MTKKQSLRYELSYFIFMLKANKILNNLKIEQITECENKMNSIIDELKNIENGNIEDEEIPKLCENEDYQDYLEWKKSLKQNN